MASISAKVKDGTPITVDFHIPADLDGLVAHFGKDVVYSKAVDALTIDVQALMRRHMVGTEKTPAKSAEEIQKLVHEYKPGVGRAKANPVEKAAKLLDSLSPEDKKALLKSLRGGN